MEPPAEGAHVLLPDDRRPEKNRTNDRDQFCPYSLEDWIAAAERAAVPHVPATRVAMFEREDLRHHEYHGPHQQRLDEAFADVARARTGDVMMRWDCCATAELKAAMSDRSENGPPPREIRQALAVDHRLLEILDEFPRIGVPVWRRPWLGAEIVIEGGWPIEYRAFVKNGELTGISSYYVQRPLPRRDDEIDAVPQRAREPIPVTLGLQRRAPTHAARVASVSTRTGIHGGHQDEPRRKYRRPCRTRVMYRPVFEGLS